LDGESGHRYLIHDRDSVFSADVDVALRGFGLTVLKTPTQSLMANADCERVIGTIRRECFDYLIPLNERRLRRILREFLTHYNRGRPHSALGLVRFRQRFLPATIDMNIPWVRVAQAWYPAAYIMNIVCIRKFPNRLE
jgi:transposase InsO family protein